MWVSNAPRRLEVSWIYDSLHYHTLLLKAVVHIRCGKVWGGGDFENIGGWAPMTTDPLPPRSLVEGQLQDFTLVAPFLYMCVVAPNLYTISQEGKLR